jgi:phosphatidylglycerol:prolipoprotein diacylglycerol transferase
VFETLGYAGGYAVYRRARMREGDFLNDERRWVVIAATAFGALVGSRVLGLLEQAPARGMHWGDFLRPGGKTIVGGLLGGWLAVEIAKLVVGIRSRTGDLFAVPICVGVAIGRVGCFLAGLADDTYGTATTMPWGVDFGDGVRRHPTQLYELVFLLGLAWVLTWVGKRPHRTGAVFRVFVGAYLGWRLGIEFLKPEPVVGGLDVIQWACIVGLVAVGMGEMGRGVENA